MNEKKQLNSILITLRWTDMDAYGHVGNSRFFDFMTDARVNFAKLAIMDDLSKHYVVVNAQCSFKQPVYYPGNMIVKQYCEKVGNSSITLSYTFSAETNPDVICAEGSVVLVCFDPKLKTAVRIPEELRTQLVLHATSF